MKMSIRTRLFITVSLVIVFFVAFSWVMNTSYLEQYYYKADVSRICEETMKNL